MISEEIVKQLIEDRIKYMHEMYSRFIQEESPLRQHPIDFKNFVVWDLEQAIKKI